MRYHSALYRHVGRAVAAVNRDPMMRRLMHTALGRPTDVVVSWANGLPNLGRIVQHADSLLRPRERRDVAEFS